MGKAVKAVVGIVLIAVGLYTGQGYLTNIGWGLLLGAAAEALAPKQRVPGSSGIQVEYGGQVEPRVIIYGTMRTSGLNVIPPVVSGDQNKYLHQVLAITGHEVNDITDVYLDKELVEDGDIGSITGADTDGAISTGTYSGKLWLRRYLGTSGQTADYILQNAVWSSVYRGRGVAYLAMRYEFDPEVYKQGKPEVSCVVQGKKCYDPRLDSSPGADPTNASYIAYTVNPALHLADFITDENLGMGEDASRVDWDLVVAAANICEESVTIPGPSTQDRYTCNVAFEATQRYEETLEILAGAMMGHVFYSCGQWRMYAGAWSSSAFSLSETDLTGPLELLTEIPRNEKYNFVRGWFLDSARDYQQGEFQPRSDSSYESDDGERITREVQFPACTNEYEAQRNAILLLRRSRNRRIATLTCGMSAYRIRPFETGTCTLTELGWTDQTVRCIGWQFTPNGQVRVTLREETSTQWSDPLTADYTVPGSLVASTPGTYIPGPVQSLTSSAVSDGVLLQWSVPFNYIGGVIFDIYEYTAATPFGSATKIGETPQSSITLGKTDTTTRYYWVQARYGTVTGPEEPAGDGIAGKAAAVAAGFRASASPTSVGKTTTSAGGTTPTTTVTPVNGTAPYTYAWTRVSGDASTSANSATSAATTFSRSSMSVGVSYNSTWRCTVTDNVAATATCDVSVHFARIDSA